MHDAGRVRRVCMMLVGCVGHVGLCDAGRVLHDAGRSSRVCMMLVGRVGYA